MAPGQRRDHQCETEHGGHFDQPRGITFGLLHFAENHRRRQDQRAGEADPHRPEPGRFSKGQPVVQGFRHGEMTDRGGQILDVERDHRLGAEAEHEFLEEDHVDVHAKQHDRGEHDGKRRRHHRRRNPELPVQQEIEPTRQTCRSRITASIGISDAGTHH